MREILFRGKRTDNGEWVEGYVAKRPDAIQFEEGPHSPWYIDKPPKDPDDHGGVYNIDPETIGQFTGLKDRNGTRIFEGDICLCDRNINDHIDKKEFIVEFEPLRGWIGTSKDGWSEFDGSAWECAEVIGNIHDNPELLTEKEGTE